MDTAVLTVPEGAATVHVLPARRAGSHERGAWALPGAFLHDGETLADAVLRSLHDKAGVQGLAPRQLHVFDDPTRDDRGWVLSVAHLYVVPWPRIAPAATAREDVHLVAVEDASGLPFDHDAIVTRAPSALRDRYREHPNPDRLLPSPFTLHELRALHEAVLGQALPKDTFRRHMQPQLRATTRYRQGVGGKPALLFRHPRTRTWEQPEWAVRVAGRSPGANRPGLFRSARRSLHPGTLPGRRRTGRAGEDSGVCASHAGGSVSRPDHSS